MNRRSLLLSAGAAGLSACATGPSARPTLPFADRLDTAIARAMSHPATTPGLAVAVYSAEGIYARGFGTTDIVTGERVSADTAFYVASVTKPITALALSCIEARGGLDLGATLAGFAPDAPFPEAVRPEAVRLRDLLTHTSGITNRGIGFRFSISGQHDPDLLWQLLGASTQNAEAPLGRYDYTNVGYNIATLLTDRRLETTWRHLLQREVFGPARLTRTTTRMSQAATESWSVARPHFAARAEGPERLTVEKVDQTMHSAGGHVMSANDAARWLELVIEGGRIGGRQVLPAAATARALEQPIVTGLSDVDGFPRTHYGLGWYLGAYRDEAMAHCGGAFSGFRAFVAYKPAAHLGLALFANDISTSTILLPALAAYIFDCAAGVAAAEASLADLPDRNAQIVAAIAADRARRAGRTWTLTQPRSAYAGSYANDEIGTIDVSVAGERMEVRAGVLSAVAEPFTQPDTIRVELVPAMGEVIAFNVADARVTALRYLTQQFNRVA
jgi:CubicO group peptidase (beta-lactamase class C family)